MKYQKARKVFAGVFVVSVIGWLLFGVFLKPDDLFGPELRSGPSTDPNNVWPLPLVFGAVLAPVVSALGWVSTIILDLREQRDEREMFEWEIE